MGYDFDKIIKMVSEIFKIAVRHILSPGKYPEQVMARGVLAYWSVRELGISCTDLAKRFKMRQPGVPYLLRGL
jgi:chromosomal replication initiation ATPase DnaA